MTILTIRSVNSQLIIRSNDIRDWKKRKCFNMPKYMLAKYLPTHSQCKKKMQIMSRVRRGVFVLQFAVGEKLIGGNYVESGWRNTASLYTNRTARSTYSLPFSLQTAKLAS